MNLASLNTGPPLVRTAATESIAAPALKWNVAWNLAGSLGYAAAQWGMLIVLAKLGSTQMVGVFTLGLAITTPIFLFVNLQLRVIHVTDARDRFSFGDFLGLRLIGVMLALIAVGVIAGFRDAMTAMAIAAVALTKAVEAVSDIVHASLQKHEQLSLIALSLMFKGAAGVAALLLALMLTADLAIALCAVAGAWLLVLLAFELPRSRRLSPLRPRFHADVLKSMAELAWPLGLTLLLLSLQLNIPRYFLEQQAGLQDLGVFGALSYLVVACSVLINAMGQAASARLSRFWATGRRLEFRQLTMQLAACALLIGLVGIAATACFGKPLLQLLYGAEYARHSSVLMILMLGGALLFVAQILGYAMTAAGLFRVQPVLFGAICALVMLGSWWLVPILGMTGAAWVSVAGALVQLLGTAALLFAAWRRSDESP